MSNDQTWVEALNINPEMLAEWSSQAPQGKPLLVYCLEEGHVSVPEYMEWACDHFGLPVLSAGYFHEVFDSQSLKNYRHEESWAPWYFPVEQWDGVTFVACIEPPHEDPQDNVRYVLADPRAMRDAWEAAAPSEAAAAEASVQEAPQGFSLNIPKFTAPAIPEEQPAASQEAPTVVAAAEPDAPVGVNLSAAKSFKLNFDEATVLFKSPEATPKTEKAPAPKPEPEPAPVSEDTLSSRTVVRPVQTPKTTSKNEYTSASTLAAAEKLKSYIPNDEELACKQVFDTLNQHYEHSFIMKCSGEEALIYKWDDKLKIADPSAVNLSLTFPTFMRVVYRTQMPYHGYLVDSPAHRELFELIGITELPACVTAIPLKVNGKLWGVLVSVGGEDMQALYQLQYAEGAADQLMRSVESNWSKAG